ncbi:hypothetical protein Val02_92420 [Virgisporangium aliadipatigenens]|uniref:Uncharacterized protein n=1 Tax=Virgisporangium aliadipatigenens TaxID=741659 RepID=A0A8J3YZ30_9ACTN|nr:hypothetical protein [Virgisporangium aliadipatigenens]GIJ52356.1 hypothetical protein Val02_92420 [Virgisporangium aliadipatigenens]
MDAGTVALASSAASILVSDMTRDGWVATRRTVVGLWQRHRPEATLRITAALDDARAELLAARSRGDHLVADELIAEWQGRLRRLLVSAPQVAHELRAELGILPSTPAPRDNRGSVSSAGRETYVRGNARHRKDD